MSFPSPFGRYWLEEKIAAGGMAEIFKAKLVGVEGFEKTLVIKRILPFWSERSDFIRMLVDEAKVLVHLNHPNIVQVFELGRVGPTYFIAMEYVPGGDLRQLVRGVEEAGEAFPQGIGLSILIKSLWGLHYAHERRLEIVHRDISPQNILLSVDGEVKVSDFGIAKAITQTQETQTGVLKGKYAFMSPEQALGRALDRRSDLFSMGIVLYELVMGQRLFSGSSDLETLEKVRQAVVPWPEPSTAKLLPGLREVIAKALEREKETRFQSAEEFAEALERCLPGGKVVPVAKMGDFFRSVFANKPALPAAPPARQTAVVPMPGEKTISLVEAPEALLQKSSGLDAVPRPPSLSPLKKFLPYFLGLVWLVAAGGFAWWLIPQKSALEAPAPAVSGTVVPGPVAPGPAAPEPVAPEPVLGSLEVGVRPEKALIRAKFGDREEKAQGRLRLAALPAGTQVDLKASLEGYESFSQKLEIATDHPNVTKDIQLNKLPPQFGGLRVNAIPWGRVTVPGLIGGQETPVVRTQMAVGSYSVVVGNPSVGKTLSTRVSIRPGQTTVCTADFEGESKIQCR